MSMSSRHFRGSWNILRVSSAEQIRHVLQQTRPGNDVTADAHAMAMQQAQWMHEQILVEKQTLSNTFSTLVGVFWAISMYVVVRKPRRPEVWAMLPITAVFPLSLYARIWVCNWLLHLFWADAGSDRTLEKISS